MYLVESLVMQSAFLLHGSLGLPYVREVLSLPEELAVDM